MKYFLIIAFSFIFGSLLWGEVSRPTSEIDSRDQVEWLREYEKCRDNLMRIRELICQYRSIKGALPGTLNDLWELADQQEYFICPTISRTDDFSIGVDGFQDNFKKDTRSTYNYEFSNVPINPAYLPPGMEEASEYDYKLLVYKNTSVADKTPIVRCLKHHFLHDGQSKLCLNISVKGEIYESNEYWESNFTNIVATRLYPFSIFKHQGIPPVSPRSPSTPESCLNIERYYNSFFDSPWMDIQPPSYLHSLPYGTHGFNAVLFDVRGLIQLVPLPHQEDPQVVSIDFTRRRVQSIHLLHSMIFYKKGLDEDRYAQPVPVLKLEGLEGRALRTESILTNGIHAGFFRRYDDTPPPIDPLTQTAYLEKGVGLSQSYTFRLFQTQVKLAQPAFLDSLRFTALTNEIAAPFLVGITLN